MIEEILKALEALKDLTNENGKSQIEAIKGLIRSLRVVEEDSVDVQELAEEVVAEEEPEEEKEDVQEKEVEKPKRKYQKRKK